MPATIVDAKELPEFGCIEITVEYTLTELANKKSTQTYQLPLWFTDQEIIDFIRSNRTNVKRANDTLPNHDELKGTEVPD